MYGRANGSSTKKAKNILTVPTCVGVKESRPFFIKMNELPQITVNPNNKINGNAECFFRYEKVI